MRPDDGAHAELQAADDVDLPIAADVRAVDEELREAGDQAQRQLRGSTQATRLFTVNLRARLLDAFGEEDDPATRR